jgi:ketosteroid isomerase-like protein
MRGLALALVLAAGTSIAHAQQAARAPDWARPLLSNDMEASAVRSGTLTAPEGGVAVRLTIAPASGGVGRLIRYNSGAGGATLKVRRFTGHPRNGWSLWGGESALEIVVSPAKKAEIDTLVRSALGAAVITGAGSTSRERPCLDGELAWIEAADGARALRFEKRCDTEGATGALAKALSNLAGGRDEEELYQSGVQEVLGADRAFAAAAVTEGVSAAFATFAGEDARVFLARLPVVNGRQAVMSQYAGWDPEAKLSWTPEGADIAARGDMGYSWGRWTISQSGREPASGHYLSVWRRDGDGQWKFSAHMGN